jgi:beta-glucanase (GH16 family)
MQIRAMTRCWVLVWIYMAGSLCQAWELVWSDEFSGEGLPDKNKWTTEVGYLRNQEKQYYTGNRTENVRIENGSLILECRKDNFKIPDAGNALYSSVSITTQAHQDWQYGKFEVRAKMPQGNGVWASLWLMGASDSKGSPWPACGEIDIAEHVGKEPENIYGTVHFQDEGKHRKEAFLFTETKTYKDFHVYVAEWGPDRIEFFCDGRKYGTFQVIHAGEGNLNPFHHPFFLMISLALGGSWGGPIDDTILPQRMLVDYVRVYQDSERVSSGKEILNIDPLQVR